MSVRFLIVEDCDDDVLLIERAFRQTGLEVPEILTDGRAALQRLHAADATAPPDVVLLDLKLPGLGGIEVLAQIRAHPWTRTLPVVVLSTSNEPRDVRQAYDHGANSYLRKPVEFEAFAHIVSALGAYWALNLLPDRRTSAQSWTAQPAQSGRAVRKEG